MLERRSFFAALLAPLLAPVGKLLGKPPDTLTHGVRVFYWPGRTDITLIGSPRYTYCITNDALYEVADSGVA